MSAICPSCKQPITYRQVELNKIIEEVQAKQADLQKRLDDQTGGAK